MTTCLKRLAQSVGIFVHTYSGYENKVKKNLEKRVESMNMTEQIFRVVIPEEEETQVKDGKAKNN